MTTQLIRRIVTTHNDNGMSVIALDETTDFRVVGPGAQMTAIWGTSTVPASNDGAPDPVMAPLGSEKGSIVRVVDFEPGAASPMHRTPTIDYAVVLSGEIDLLLDEGAPAIIGPNTIVVQRGTRHAWRNSSDTRTARVLFVLVEAEPVLYNGEQLPAEGL